MYVSPDTSREDFVCTGIPAQGMMRYLPTRPPSRLLLAVAVDLGFRSLYGCGAAGDFHPSSTRASVFESG